MLPSEYLVESATKNSDVYFRAVKAGGTAAIDCYGNAFFVVNSNGNLWIKTDAGAFRPYHGGNGEKYPDLFRFKRLEIKNENSFDVIVVIWAGFGEYVDRNFYQMDAPTTLVGADITSIDALTFLDFTGVPAVAGQIKRRSIIITNLDPVNVIEYYSKNNLGVFKAAGVVMPRTAIELLTNDHIRVKNETGVEIQARVCEIWFVQ